MKLVNIDYIPGKELEVLEIVKGTVVQSKNFGTRRSRWARWRPASGRELRGF